MSMQSLYAGSQFVTVNGLILTVVETVLAAGDEFTFSKAVGRTNGRTSDLPNNVFVHRKSDGMRFKQAGDEGETNFDREYVSAPVAQAPAATPTTGTPPAGTPKVGERAELANGLVVEVTGVAQEALTGRWIVTSKAIGRTRRAPEHVRGRELPRNTFKHDAVTAQRIDARLSNVNTDVIGKYEGTPAFDFDASRVDEAAPVRSAFSNAPLDDDLPF